MKHKIECFKCNKPIVHAAFIICGEYICLDCFKEAKIQVIKDKEMKVK